MEKFEINKQSSTDNNPEADRLLFVIMSVLFSIFLSCIAVLTVAKITDLHIKENVTFIVVFIISLFCFFSAYERSYIVGLKYTVPILMGIIILIFAIQNINDKGSIEKTQKCLVDYDWVYPSGKNPLGAWKFSSDGTFNSSSTLFGGMSTWGNWKIISPGKINVSYTRTSEGTIPNDQVLTLSGCNSLSVGSTTFVKD